MGAHPTFVGRERELAVLREAWSLGSRGARQVVFVGGEPGVGKSSAVAQVMTALHAQGAAVLLGTCVSTMGAPYQPFVEPVQALADAIAGGQLMADRPDAERERTLQALRIIVGRTDSEHHRELQSSRQLFDDCVRALRAAAHSHPLLLVVEDLHWAGDTALQLLRYLVARTSDARLTILATHRTTPPDRSADVMATVAELYRLDGVRRLDIDGLRTEEIAEYLAVEARVQRSRAGGAAALLRDLTGGNPFLLREVWRELAARGGVGALQDANLRAPESVLDTVFTRLSGLPAKHRRTVEYAAVIGEEFPVALVTAVARWAARAGPDRAAAGDIIANAASSAAVVDAAALTYAGLEAAVAVGLVDRVRDSDGVFRFPHGLARQAVLDLIGDFQRAAANACVAEVLENEFPAADRRVPRLAHHYAAAQALGYASKATHYLTAAGRAAEAGLAHHEAARLYERAAAISADPVGRDELKLRAARAWLRSSHFGRARELDAQVATAGTDRQRLRAAIGFEAASWRTGQPGEHAVSLLTAALAAVDLPPADPLVIRGTAALGRAEAFTANIEHGRCLNARAITLARESGDDVLLATVLQSGLQIFSSPADLGHKLASAMELTDLAERIGDLRHLGAAAYHRAAICYVLGDLRGVTVAQRDLARVVSVTCQPFWEWVGAALTFGLQFLRADFIGAAGTVKDGRELGRSFGPESQPEGPFGLQSFILRRETGGLEQVRGLISGNEDPASRWAPGLLALYRELGLKKPAARVLRHLLTGELQRHRTSATWPVVLSFLAEAAVWLDDAGASRRIHPLIAEYAGMNLMGGEFSALMGSADRHLGALESLLGMPSADARFAVAVEMDARLDSPVHLATTLATQVAHLRRTGHRTGRVVELSHQARTMSAQYGLSRVDRLLEDAERLPVSHGPQPAGLTSRELEVLGLLRGGLTNRRIAETLFISENTAANHVRSILLKTGAANRTQAALFGSIHD